MLRAICNASMNAFENAEGEIVYTPLGRSMMIQRQITSSQTSPVFVRSNWARLEKNAVYGLSIVDDDLDDCASQTVIATLNDFTSDGMGMGGMSSKSEEISLGGEDNLYGKWLKLSKQDELVTCCQISEATSRGGRY